MLRLIPLREADLEAACQFITEAKEWSPRSDTFVPPMAVLGKPDSLWMSALEGEELIGVIGYHNISWPDGSAEMFTAVVPKWRGSGAAVRVVKTQLAYAFSDLGLRRITMQALEGSPSAKIADHLKVPLEGRFPNARLKRGVYHTALAYGLERNQHELSKTR